MSIYLLDANVFIEAKNRYYDFDVCPAFWDWLTAKNADKCLFSVEAVFSELKQRDDDLLRWGKTTAKDFFLTPDEAVVSAMKSIASWAQIKKQQNIYKDIAFHIFQDSTDFYLVAHALAHGMTVVTHEKHINETVGMRNKLRNIKIPNICRDLGVGCMTCFEMLKKEKALFVLAQIK